jgi:phosphoribosylanthranilate isomerase
MTVEAKICGVKTPEAAEAALAGGARLIGFIFYPPSPRALDPEQAGVLARQIGARALRTGVFVDPSDELLARYLAAVPLDLLQLHGKETPRRVAEIRARWGLPVMKSISVARPEDLAPVEAYAGVADRLLFDAKPPKDMKNALPGGNAVAFDWRILAGRRFARPWLLSGGLGLDNVKQAVEISGAPGVDVSSGVESAPGEKDLRKIGAFLDVVRAL